MQTREELYDFLGYHAYEDKLDALFSEEELTVRAGRALSRRLLPSVAHRIRSGSAPGLDFIQMSETSILPKAKKSVALSGVAAGNTALCTVGRTGNDLHYRGYDILDVATKCEFEEIAYLLVHGVLPTATELQHYKAKLKSLRGLPAPVKAALELLPAVDASDGRACAPACSALGCVLPEKDDHNVAGARDIADRLMA